MLQQGPQLNYTTSQTVPINSLAGSSLALRRLTVSTVNSRADTNDSLMDSSLNAVVLLNIQLGKSVVLVSGGITDITKGRSIDNVSDI
jgi:hypothetical protein